MMRVCPTILAALLIWAGGPPGARSEITEEETWHDAEGKVVKTVKRTYTGAEARRAADWEPAWVIRERRRDSRSRGRHVSRGRIRTGGWYHTPVYLGYVCRPYYRHRCGTAGVIPHRRGVGVGVRVRVRHRSTPHCR